jgi:fumarate reductase flavoprotein subunit
MPPPCDRSWCPDVTIRSRLSSHYDLICVGAGSAGMPLAIQAAKRGLHVLQLEADERIGGTLHYSAGQLAAAQTQLQRELAIDDSPEEFYADAQRIAHGTIDADLLRLFTTHSAELVDWLMASGFEPVAGSPVAMNYHAPYRTRRYLWGAKEAVSIYEALYPQYAKLRDSGAIDLRLRTRLSRLLTAADGSVQGVEAEYDSERERFFGRSVVLATGGYAASPDVWHELGPDSLSASYCNPYSRGDGILAARNVGAMVDGSDKFCPTFAGVRDDPDDPCSGLFLDLEPRNRAIWEIYLDRNGQRFMREDHPNIEYRERSLLAQPDLAMTVLFDAGILMNALPLMDMPAPQFLSRFGTQRNFLVADSVDGLAHQLALEPRVLRETVERYNGFVAKGVDDDFGRDFLIRGMERAPFYAIRACGISVVSPAGIRVDGTLRVTDGHGKPIGNLYAVGEVTGFTRLAGNTFVGGLSLTPALTLGYWLGKTLL